MCLGKGKERSRWQLWTFQSMIIWTQRNFEGVYGNWRNSFFIPFLCFPLINFKANSPFVVVVLNIMKGAPMLSECYANLVIRDSISAQSCFFPIHHYDNMQFISLAQHIQIHKKYKLFFVIYHLTCLPELLEYKKMLFPCKNIWMCVLLWQRTTYLWEYHFIRYYSFCI